MSCDITTLSGTREHGKCSDANEPEASDFSQIQVGISM